MSSTSPFGAWLKARRNALDLRREDLAERIGCSPKTLEKIELGERRPSRQVAELLAEQLRVPADEVQAFVRFARLDLSSQHSKAAATPHIPHTLAGNGQAPWRALHMHLTNLPAEPANIIGREKEVQDVTSLLLRTGVRLVTLTGAPGIGKTSLAIRAGAELIGEFGEGVFFVKLAAITDPALVVPTIARSLGLSETAGQPPVAALIGYLSTRRLLVILDNFEQVLQAATTVASLLEECPWLKVLVTSREALHMRSERRYDVPPLEVPRMEEEGLGALQAHDIQSAAIGTYSAVALFVDRAQASHPDFVLTPDNARAVATICARLDGLPLAIELAAARIHLFPPQTLLERLERRLETLTVGARDLPARQQTLGRAIQWSYDLLDDGERQLFQRLAVFQGGCRLDAIEAVYGADSDRPVGLQAEVESLIGKSLLKQEEGTGGEPRPVMLETIQEYAREKLEESGEAELFKETHAEYFLELAEEAAPKLRGPDLVRWLARLGEELGNFRAAIAWALAVGHVEIALRLAVALGPFWDRLGYFTEGRNILSEALSYKDVHVPGAIRAAAYHVAGTLAGIQGDFETAEAYMEESLQISRALGDRSKEAYALQRLGVMLRSQGKYALARSYQEAGLAIQREIHDEAQSSITLNGLGETARIEGDYALAIDYYEQSLAIDRSLSDISGIAMTLQNLGHAVYRQGDYLRAGEIFTESLRLGRETKYMRAVAGCLVGLAGVSTAQNSLKHAAKLLAAATNMHEVLSSRFDTADLIEYERNLAAARTLLSEDAFEEVWQEGRAMSMEEAVTYAMELERRP